MADHKLTVWQRPYVVSVDRIDDNKWVATGIYYGKTLRAEGQTAGTALKKWRAMALGMRLPRE